MRRYLNPIFLTLGIIVFTACEKGSYKCTCVNADDELSHQSVMEGPKDDMENACNDFVGGGGNQGNGPNTACTLTEQ